MCQSQGLEFATGIEYMLNFVWITICLSYITRILCHFLNDLDMKLRWLRKLRWVICVNICLDSEGTFA